MTGNYPIRDNMPYKNPATINISQEIKDDLAERRGDDETWEKLLLALLDYWDKGHKNNKKIDQAY